MVELQTRYAVITFVKQREDQFLQHMIKKLSCLVQSISLASQMLCSPGEMLLNASDCAIFNRSGFLCGGSQLQVQMPGAGTARIPQQVAQTSRNSHVSDVSDVSYCESLKVIRCVDKLAMSTCVPRMFPGCSPVLAPKLAANSVNS